MEQIITVGLGELVVSDDPQTVLVAFGLGSCVGVTAWDPVRKAGGMLHAMLSQCRNNDRNITKYVDTGAAELLNRMLRLGAKKEHLVWRFAGGAQMLTAPGLADRFNIGAQNVAKAHETIALLGFRLTAHDTGGYEGRTVRLFLVDGRLLVRGVNSAEHSL
jgi:chemotaxis protein CheD